MSNLNQVINTTLKGTAIAACVTACVFLGKGTMVAHKVDKTTGNIDKIVSKAKEEGFTSLAFDDETNQDFKKLLNNFNDLTADVKDKIISTNKDDLAQKGGILNFIVGNDKAKLLDTTFRHILKRGLKFGKFSLKIKDIDDLIKQITTDEQEDSPKSENNTPVSNNLQSKCGGM